MVWLVFVDGLDSGLILGLGLCLASGLDSGYGLGFGSSLRLGLGLRGWVSD